MGTNIAVYIVNGSSLGGGEIDAIERASIFGGTLVVKNVAAENFLTLASSKGVQVKNIKWLLGLPKSYYIELHLSRFLRDVILIPQLIFLKSFRNSRVKIIIGVHSDPRSGIGAISLRLRLGLAIFEIFCLGIGDEIRFVSRRQMKTFKKLAARKNFYIDPPCSVITNKYHTSEPRANTWRDLGLVYIGRISSSRFLGDAKNARFLLEILKHLDDDEILYIYGNGSNSKLIRELEAHPRCKLFPPVHDVESVLHRTKTLIVPSLHEGYCLIVREASIFGCQVITTKAVACELTNLTGIQVLNSLDAQQWVNAARRRK